MIKTIILILGGIFVFLLSAFLYHDPLVRLFSSLTNDLGIEENDDINSEKNEPSKTQEEDNIYPE